MAEVFAGIPNQRPSLEHPLGTQSEGRDLLAVIMLGTPATLAIGLIGGGVAVLIGGILGFTAGYFGGRIDAVIRTIVDIGLTIPPLAILIMIAAAFPLVSIPVMGLVIACTEWMWATRVIRAQVLTLREREFVRVAKLSGPERLRRHPLRACAEPSPLPRSFVRQRGHHRHPRVDRPGGARARAAPVLHARQYDLRGDLLHRHVARHVVVVGAADCHPGVHLPRPVPDQQRA